MLCSCSLGNGFYPMVDTTEVYITENAISDISTLSFRNHYEYLRVSVDGNLCRVQIYRPDANNAINSRMLHELYDVFGLLEQSLVSVVVLEGLPEVFCFGADFKELSTKQSDDMAHSQDPEYLFQLWKRIVESPMLTIAHVRGKVNAGGVGFVAACDIVIADDKAVFSLSEMLFGLIPACVMPFLIRKVGMQKAKYLTLTTQSIDVKTAKDWGLVDDYAENSEGLVNRQLIRLRRLDKKAIARFKRFMSKLAPELETAEPIAVATNREVFSDAQNLAAIERYVKEGLFPWN